MHHGAPHHVLMCETEPRSIFRDDTDRADFTQLSKHATGGALTV